MVESISILIETIRGDQPLPVVRDNIHSIVDAVDSILAGAGRGSNEPSSYQGELKLQTSPIQNNLEDCKIRLMRASQDSHALDNQPSAKGFAQKIPPLAFQIGKETRELVRRVQNIRAGGGDDDFS